MMSRLKMPALAVLCVLGIALVSNLLAYGMPQTGQANLLTAAPEPMLEEATEAQNLIVLEDEQSHQLKFSSRSPVYYFAVGAQGTYTLRYLSFQIESENLQPLTEWTLHQMNKGLIDYSAAVGHAETWEDGQLIMRLSSSRGEGYLAEDTEHFVLVGNVLQGEGVPRLSVQVTSDEWA